MSAWQTIMLQITPLSPLHLGAESNLGNVAASEHVIPGAMVRGAVAAAILNECTHRDYWRNHADCPAREDCPFWQVFNPAHEPLWGFGYPAPFPMAWPFPLTARTCKRDPGYERRDSGKLKGHGVYDALIGQVVDGMLADPRFPQRDQLQPNLGDKLAKIPALLRTTCPICDQPLKPASGVYAYTKDTKPSYAEQVSVRRATHVGINRARSVAEDSLLFTQESLDMEAQRLDFYARVHIPQVIWPTVAPYLNGYEYHIGRGRSRGQGRVAVYAEEITPPDLTERIEAFNLAVNGALKRLQPADDRIQAPLSGTLFSITLRSPLILERFGQPRAVIEPEDIGLADRAHLIRAWARTEVIGGWDSAARLPRRTHLAMQAGSAFVYWTPTSTDENALVDHLTEIEMTGIGAERARGYGHVSVCAPFHTFNRLDMEEREAREKRSESQ